jgi:hypothetical protein
VRKKNTSSGTIPIEDYDSSGDCRRGIEVFKSSMYHGQYFIKTIKVKGGYLAFVGYVFGGFHIEMWKGRRIFTAQNAAYQASQKMLVHALTQEFSIRP